MLRPMELQFEARGHSAILSTHPTTLEITSERNVTARGDCIVAVGSSIGLKDLPISMKKALADDDSRVFLTFQIANQTFSVEGRGDPHLTFSHPTDFVIRRSGFVSNRTLMVHANRSAADIPRAFVRLLQDPTQKVIVDLAVET